MHKLLFLFGLPVTMTAAGQQTSITDSVGYRIQDSLAGATVYAYYHRGGTLSVPASVALQSREQLMRYDPASLSALNMIPGVKFDERSPGSYRLSIRGNLLRSAFGVRNVKVYLDDLPYTDASGNTYLNAFSPNLLQTAEIVKGPAGSMYGAGTGGALFMRPGNSRDFEVKADLSAGNLGSINSSLEWRPGHAGIHYLQVSHGQSDGYRDQSAMRRENIFYRLQKNVGHHRIKTNVFAGQLAYETPGGLTSTEANRNPQQARPRAGINPGAIEQLAAVDLKILYANVSDEVSLGNGFTLNGGLYLSVNELINPTIRNYEEKRERGGGGRVSLIYRRNVFDLVSGIEYQSSYANTSTFGNRKGVRDTLQYNDVINAGQVNVFAQSVVRLPWNTEFTAGVSYNDFSYRFLRVNEGGLRERGNFKPQVIPRATLLKKFTEALSAYLSYSKGYSPPTIDEIHASDGIFNTALRAESAENYEGGLKGALLKNQLSFSFAYYLLHLQNTIVSRRDVSGADFYVNAGSTDQRGAELSMDFASIPRPTRFVRRYTGAFSFGSTRAFFKNYKQGTADFSGNRLTGTPLHTLSASAGIETAPGVYAAVSFVYTDRIPLNDANTFFEDPRLLWMTRIGWKAAKGLVKDIFFSSQRSTEAVYSAGNDINAAGNRFFNPAAPFIYRIGLTLSF